MLRMGKKTDQTEADQTTDTRASQYSTSNYGTHTSGEHQRAYTETPASPRAVTESESLARDIKEGTLSGYVGNGTVLTGETTFKAMLRVDGQLSGQITSDAGTLIVGTNGKVDANIEVAVAVIHGTVNGDVIASQRLELGRAARVNGNIQTPSLMIEQGAIFEGGCRMAQARAAVEKGRGHDEVRTEEPLDTTELAIATGDDADPADFSSYTAVAS